MQRLIEIKAYECSRAEGHRLIKKLRDFNSWKMAVDLYKLGAFIKGELEMDPPKILIEQDLAVAEKVMGWQLMDEQGPKRWPYFYSYQGQGFAGRVIVFEAPTAVGYMFSPSSDPASSFIMEESLRVRGLGESYKKALAEVGLRYLDEGAERPENWNKAIWESLNLRIEAARKTLS